MKKHKQQETRNQSLDESFVISLSFFLFACIQEMKPLNLLTFFLALLLGTATLQDEFKNGVTTFEDVTSLDVSNEEQELERLMAVTDHDISKQAPRLKCYSCASTESWEDCEKTQILVGCPQASTRCIKGSITLKKPHGPKITEYFKSCVSAEKCSTQHFPACQAGAKESAQCSIECCDQLFCNKEIHQLSIEASKASRREEFMQLEENENKRQFSFNCQAPCLIYATNNQINGIELKTSRKVQGMTSLQDVRAIDVDVVTQTVYWSDKAERVIKRSSLLSGATEVVIGGENGIYDGIAVEWLGRLLYWTDFTHKRIGVAKLDGSSRKTIIDSNIEKPRAIALDPQQGILFFTDWGALPRLERSSLSGQDRRVLISTGLSWPNGLVIDYSNKKLYICESFRDRIESINYDGSDRRVLYSIANIHPFDLALYKNTLFWGDWQDKLSIEKVDITTGKRLPGLGMVSADKPVNGMAVLDDTRQPRATSPCSLGNGRCSHLCFTIGLRTRVCGCPNNVTLLADQRTCDLGVTTASSAPTITSEPTTVKTTTTQPSTTQLVTTQMTTAEQTTTRTLRTTKATTTEQTTEATTTVMPSTGLPPTTQNPTTKPKTTKQTTARPTPATTTTAGTTTQERTTTFPTTHHTITSRPTTKVRLVNGDSPSEGRVEVQHNGLWGTICDDYWDLRDANVVCRMLGFPEAMAAFSHAYFGPGRGRIWLDDVHCLGHETDIGQCEHRGWGSNNCQHMEDAAVKCRLLNTPKPALPIRLVNGRNQHEGRVEVFHAGRWGTICDDLWDKADADVVCRMLGYPEAITATRRAMFGRGSGKIWMDNVQCRGNERSIEECTRLNWGRHNCQHTEDAGVICRSVPHTTTKPRTVMKPTPIVTASPAPVEGFAIVCLPHSMHIRFSRKHLAKMTSLKLNPGLLHLNDPSCGASKVSDTHVTFSTPLDACGTVRSRDGNSLTFTNKVHGQFFPNSFKRVFRPPPLTFPFKCSYSRITPRDRIYAPPQHAHAYKQIEQW